MNYTLKQLEQIAKNEQISLSHHFRKHELIEILNNYYNSSSIDKLKFYTKDKLLQIVKDKNLEDNLNQIVKERNNSLSGNARMRKYRLLPSSEYC